METAIPTDLEQVKLIVLDSSTLRPDRKQVLQWIKRVRRDKQRQVVGGIVSIVAEERHGKKLETLRKLVSMPSGESRLIAQLDDANKINEVYEWAREELMSFFDTNPEFIVFDEIGPEVLHGDGLDSALRACLWRIGEEPPDFPVFIIVIADSSMVHSFGELYRLHASEIALVRSFQGFNDWLKPATSRLRDLMTLKRMHDMSPGSLRSPSRIMHSSSSSNVLNMKHATHHHRIAHQEATGKFYSFIKYPLFFALVCTIAVEFCWYVMVRQAVQVFERLRQRHATVLDKLSRATSYQSWRRRARELDALDGKVGGTAERVPLVEQFTAKLQESMSTLKRNASYMDDWLARHSNGEEVRPREAEEQPSGPQTQQGHGVAVADFVEHESEVVRTLRELAVPSFSQLVFNESLYAQNYTGMNIAVQEFSMQVVNALTLVSDIPPGALLWHHLVKRQRRSMPRNGLLDQTKEEKLAVNMEGMSAELDEPNSSGWGVASLSAFSESDSEIDLPGSLLEPKENGLAQLQPVADENSETDTMGELNGATSTQNGLGPAGPDGSSQLDGGSVPTSHERVKLRTLVVPQTSPDGSGNQHDTPTAWHVSALDDAGTQYKGRLFAELANSFGESALCLSGGASNCYFHLGVVEALLQQNCLPRHVSGASGGALIGSFLCTHTDAELQDLLKPAHLSKVYNPCSEGYYRMFVRLMQEGVLFDKSDWARKLSSQVCGTYTFREAFLRTGRSFTITVYSIKNGKEHTRSLNYRTAPDIVIYSAVLASAAIPKLLPAVQLLRKDPFGRIAPYHALGVHWRDGSFENELPFEALHQMFNVTFTIVSQVEPHISPFFYENRGSAGLTVSHGHGSGWRGGFFFAYLEKLLKLDLKKWLELIREFDLMPRIMDTDFSSVFLGRTFGSVTMVAPTRFSNYWNLVRDPNTKEKMQVYMIAGNRMTWPKLAFIQDRLRVERKLRELAIQFPDMGSGDKF